MYLLYALIMFLQSLKSESIIKNTETCATLLLPQTQTSSMPAEAIYLFKELDPCTLKPMP